MLAHRLPESELEENLGVPLSSDLFIHLPFQNRRSAGSSKYQAHGPASRELTGEERERPPN